MAEWELSSEQELIILASPGIGGDNDGARPLTGEASVAFEAETIRQSGAAVGIRGRLVAQVDNAERPAFAGKIGDCSRISALCLGPQGGIVSPYSRLSLGLGGEESGARVRLEAAYLYMDGGLGEVSLGLDEGMAARFYETGPTAFVAGRVRDPILDPSGLNIVRSRVSVSGQSAKLSYATPRFLGVRAGVSVTPAVSYEASDLDLSDRPLPGDATDLGAAVEGGLHVSRVLRDADLRVRAGVTAGWLEVESPRFDDVAAYGVGFEVSRRDAFSVGASYKLADSEGPGGLSADYEALHLGGSVEVRDFTLTLDGGWAEDRFLGVEGMSWSASVARDIGDSAEIRVGYSSDSLDFARSVSGVMQESNGLRIEFRIRNR